MDHVAIMRKDWGMIPKILSGEKTIESRWYKNRSAPWGKINTGDVVYFKNSGEAVSVKASVRKVIQFESLTSDKIREIIIKYGKSDGIEDINKYYEIFKDKKYCLLVFLEKPEKAGPFEVDKMGYGAMAAWMSNVKIPLPRISL